MKTTFTALTALAMAGASTLNVSAGDKEWATTGKILTGVMAGAVIASALEPVPVYSSGVVYAALPPRVVYGLPPMEVQPAPVIVYRRPVRRKTVYVAPPPVMCVSPPRVGVHMGFGYHGTVPVYRFCN